jgi:hypothetical protein
MAGLGVEQRVAFLTPFGGNGGPAEREGFDLSDDLFVAHAATVTDRRAPVLDLGSRGWT